ncbi:MAG: permease-like cell division protein FtsX [Acidimicrobiia bacterium]
MSFLRAPAALALLLVAVACASPARTDSAELPTTETTVTVATTVPPSSTTTTEALPEPAGPDVIAWLAPDAAATTLSEAVAEWAGIKSVQLVAGEDALAEFTTIVGDRDAGLVEGVSADALPASLRIQLAHPSLLAEVAAQLRALSDIESVETAITPACNPFRDWNVVVFVDDDRELTRLRNQLAAEHDVTDIAVIGREAAYTEFLGRFADIPDLGTSIVVQDMSVSIRARSVNPVTLSQVREIFEGDRAVKGIQVYNPGAPACP